MTETVVLVMTDVVGSTRLWHEVPDAMDVAMGRHHAIVHGAVAAHGGWRPVDQGEGDAVFAAFSSAAQAVAAVVQFQSELAAEPWPVGAALAVRVGVHAGEVITRDGNLFGDTVNRCARIRGLGSGGQVLLSAPAYELVRDKLPVGVTVLDLGEHRMKDLTRPESIWQLGGDGLDRPFPPLAGLDRVRHNLPVQSSSFVGRERELAALVASVNEHRLVTLTGFGGMGKTRLALQTAAELTDGGVGNVWFIDLAGVEDPALVPSRVAETVGVRWGGGDPVEALVSALAETPTLLVLDNLEQVLGCAGFVADLLARAPAVRVLATSREALRIRGEQQVPLLPLSLPTGTTTHEVLSTFEAVRLFVDRALSVRPDFVVDNATAPAVAAICARLDGHPLALELAAARLRVLSVDRLLVRLESALSVLTGGARDMPLRHQTLRATIAWSFESLGVDERLVLTRLATLPDEASYEMVEEVCGQGLDVLDLIEALVDKSLVRAREWDGESRFDLLVSIREYALEHVGDEERHALDERHSLFVARALVTAGEGGADNDARELGDYIGAELPHLRAALAHRRLHGPAKDFAAMVSGLRDSLIHEGLLSEAADLTGAALAATRAAGVADPDVTCRLLTYLVFARTWLLQPLREPAEELLAATRQATDPAVRTEGLFFVTEVPRDRPEMLALMAELDEAMAATPPTFLATREAKNTRAIALRYFDPEAAWSAAEGMLDDGPMTHAAMTSNLLLDRGDWQLALERLLGASAESVTGRRNPIWTARLAAGVSQALTLGRRLEEAREQAEIAVASEASTGIIPLLSLRSLADVERAEGDHEAVIRLADSALTPLSPFALRHWGSAQLRWRRVVSHRLANVRAPFLEELTAARDSFRDAPSRGLRELCGVLVELAVQVFEDDSGRAAALVASVQEHRGLWVLPFDMDTDLELLLPQLPEHAGPVAELLDAW